MKKYKHIFFDLDHTLWDYEKNAKETLYELHFLFELSKLNILQEKLLEVYRLVNFELWRSYNKGLVNKDELREIRFFKTLGHLGINDRMLAAKMEEAFLEICPKKPHVLPNCIEVLEYLREKYVLHIITNGFKGSTNSKLVNSGLKPFFKETITSECIGITKPNAAIFEYAIKKAGTNAEESIMIGDNPETDIQGAFNTGMDRIHYNPRKRDCQIEMNHSISDLIELKNHL